MAIAGYKYVALELIPIFISSQELIPQWIWLPMQFYVNLRDVSTNENCFARW